LAVVHRFSAQPLLIARRHIARILPAVEEEVDRWVARAREIPDPELRRQALSSLKFKRFHCQGGSVFATWEPEHAADLISFIVAFQTISDYLDNLCDRTDSFLERDFRRLHDAMLDAVSPGQPVSGDYYEHHLHKDDGGYLDQLVERCRQAIARFPGYFRVEPQVRSLVGLYADLQVYKHLRLEERVGRLVGWFEEHRGRHPELCWWEFAAASGSTLGVYALVAEASRKQPVEDQGALVDAYFPWVCGLHILLDYLIDQSEDKREGDLNFVSFYPSPAEALRRMLWMIENAKARTAVLRDPHFHETVIEGLVGLYLTDRKVRRNRLGGTAARLVSAAGWRAWLVWLACHLWRVTKRESRRSRAL